MCVSLVKCMRKLDSTCKTRQCEGEIRIWKTKNSIFVIRASDLGMVLDNHEVPLTYVLYTTNVMNMCDQICKNPPHTHTMTTHIFHCQSIALSISSLYM